MSEFCLELFSFLTVNIFQDIKIMKYFLFPMFSLLMSFCLLLHLFWYAVNAETQAVIFDGFH